MRNLYARFAGALIFATVCLMPTQGLALQVVVTVPTLAALAREVVAGNGHVEALVSAGQDPHYADARPNLIVTLNQADVLVATGLELEVGWLPALVRQARNPKIVVGSPGYFDASQAVRRLQIPTQIDRAQGDIHPGGNPHFGLDPRAGASIVEALAARLAQVDPAHAADYQQRASALAARLRTLAAEETKKFAQLPAAQRQLVAYHDSLVYLLDWLGLRQVATLEPRPGIAPDPGQLAKVVGLIRANAIKVLVIEAYYPKAAAAQVARMTGAQLVTLPGGVKFSEGQRYEDCVRGVAASFYAALSVQ